VLPHQAVAKLGFPAGAEMTVEDCLKKLRAHLDKRRILRRRGERRRSLPPEHDVAGAPLIRAEIATTAGTASIRCFWPRLADLAWLPLHRAAAPAGAGHFGMGHGSGAPRARQYYWWTAPIRRPRASTARCAPSSITCTTRGLTDLARAQRGANGLPACCSRPGTPVVRAATDGLRTGRRKLLPRRAVRR